MHTKLNLHGAISFQAYETALLKNFARVLVYAHWSSDVFCSSCATKIVCESVLLSVFVLLSTPIVADMVTVVNVSGDELAHDFSVQELGRKLLQAGGYDQRLSRALFARECYQRLAGSRISALLWGNSFRSRISHGELVCWYSL